MNRAKLNGAGGSGWVQLLKVDVDLGQALDAEDLATCAEEVVAPSAVLKPGVWHAPRDSSSTLFVCDGLLLRELTIGRRRGAELLGPGDVLSAGDGPATNGLPVKAGVRWRVLEDTRVAVLEQRFWQSAARWPEVFAAVVDRAIARAQALGVHLAVSSLPRVEDRLLLLFWQLSDRWGRVTADGLRLNLPLTHEVLGELVGAQRPTVTSALSRLARRGDLVRCDDGGWVLQADSALDAAALETLTAAAA